MSSRRPIFRLQGGPAKVRGNPGRSFHTTKSPPLSPPQDPRTPRKCKFHVFPLLESTILVIISSILFRYFWKTDVFLAFYAQESIIRASWPTSKNSWEPRLLFHQNPEPPPVPSSRSLGLRNIYTYFFFLFVFIYFIFFFYYCFLQGNSQNFQKTFPFVKIPASSFFIDFFFVSF